MTEFPHLQNKLEPLHRTMKCNIRISLFMMLGFHVTLTTTWIVGISGFSFENKLTRNIPAMGSVRSAPISQKVRSGHVKSLSNDWIAMKLLPSSVVGTIDKNIALGCCLSLLAGLLLDPSVAIATTSTSDIGRGSVLFEQNCAGCHRGGANYIRESKTLQKDALEKYLGTDQVKVQSFVQDKMPHSMLPFKKAFTDQDYADVTSYVLDQALGEKW